MKYQEYQTALVNRATDSRLVDIAIRTAFRTFLDPSASEWRDTTVEEKLAFILLVESVGLSFKGLVQAYKEMWESHDRPDIAQAADNAMTLFAELAGEDRKWEY